MTDGDPADARAASRSLTPSRTRLRLLLRARRDALPLAAVLVLTSAGAIRPAAAWARTPAQSQAPARAQAPAPAPSQTPTKTPTHTQAQAPAPTPPRTQPQPAPATSVPRVRLVATGGTISNRPGSRLTAEELVASIPDVTGYARVEAEQFANVASSEMTLEQWLGLARRLNALFTEDADLAGLVVTSGTDTLEELAYFLHLTVRSDRPVVIVGAMRRPGIPGYEGQANLLAAFRVAADPASRGRGALVVLNDEILSAREATKTDARRLHTFQTRGYGLLGVVDADRIVYYRDVVKRHTAKSEFDVKTIDTLPRVDVLLTYQGAAGDIVRAAADLGARGIIMGTAAGATAGTQGDGVRYALEKGVVVVNTTRTGAGRIGGPPPNAPQRPAASSRTTSGASTSTSQAAPTGPAATATTPTSAASAATAGTAASNSAAPTDPQSAPPRRRAIAGEDLAPIKARILLMLALTRTSDPAEIQRMFLEY